MAGVETLRGSAEPEKRMFPGGPFDPLALSAVSRRFTAAYNTLLIVCL